MFTKIQVTDKWVPIVCLMAPGYLPIFECSTLPKPLIFDFGLYPIIARSMPDLTIIRDIIGKRKGGKHFHL